MNCRTDAGDPGGRPAASQRGDCPLTHSGRFRRSIAASLLILAALNTLGAGQDDSSGQRQRLENLPAAKRQELERKRKRFHSLPPEEQQRLRKLHADLTAAEDAQRLEEIMQRYADWLRTLTPGQRAELLSMPAEARLEQIKLLLQQQEAWRMRNYVPPELTDEDLSVIVAWAEDLVVRREDKIVEALFQQRPQLRERFDSFDASRRRDMLIYFASRPGLPRDLLRPEDEDVERLQAKLSAAAQQQLAKAQEGNRQRDLAHWWMRAAMISRRFTPEVPREELQPFYAQLDARLREYLESLPAERMQSELTRLYLYNVFAPQIESERFPFWRWGEGSRGRGTRGRPGEHSPEPPPGRGFPPEPDRAGPRPQGASKQGTRDERFPRSEPSHGAPHSQPPGGPDPSEPGPPPAGRTPKSPAR